MVQDALVTVVALAAAGLIARRVWPRRKADSPACANCASAPVKKTETPDKPKLVSFYGTKR